MPTQTQASAATAAAYTAASVQATTALRERLTAVLTAMWGSLGIYRNAQMDQFVSDAVPMVEASMAQMSSMTTGYMAALASEAGHSANPISVPTPTVETLRGVPASEVYGRPFHLVWRELHAGKSPDQAIASGLDRAVQTALTDVQLAKTHTAQSVMASTPITARPYWYKRVLEGPRNCGLCIVASTQGYHTGDLLPIHNNCDCGVEPQWTAYEHTHDEQLLQEAHAAIEETFGVSDPGARTPDYRKLILVREHSELGPVLTVEGHAFATVGGK